MIPETRELPSFELTKPSNDSFGYYRGHFVEIHLPHTRYAGTYRGLTTQGALVLQPHLGTSLAEKERERVMSLIDLPAFISFQTSGLAILPLDRAGLENYVVEHNRLRFTHSESDYSI